VTRRADSSAIPAGLAMPPEDSLGVAVDPTAPPGNLLPALARLLRRLQDRPDQVVQPRCEHCSNLRWVVVAPESAPATS
jgi:hypothetical protein